LFREFSYTYIINISSRRRNFATNMFTAQKHFRLLCAE